MFCWNSFRASLSAITSKVICFLCGQQSICESTRLAPASQPSPVHSWGKWIFSFRLCPPVLLPPASGARSVSSHGGGSRWRNHGGEHWGCPAAWLNPALTEIWCGASAMSVWPNASPWGPSRASCSCLEQLAWSDGVAPLELMALSAFFRGKGLWTRKL